MLLFVANLATLMNLQLPTFVLLERTDYLSSIRLDSRPSQTAV